MVVALASWVTGGSTTDKAKQVDVSPQGFNILNSSHIYPNIDGNLQ